MPQSARRQNFQLSPAHRAALGLYESSTFSLTGPYISAHRVTNVGFSIKAQAMGPEGALAQMSFYIFMWNVITFGHDRGCPVTAI